MSKYTPPPWKVFEDDWGQVGVEAESMIIADRIYCDWNQPPEIEAEQRANAKLIAAAPDLLKACKSALEGVWRLTAYENGYQWAVNLAAELSRAIKKAEGEE